MSMFADVVPQDIWQSRHDSLVEHIRRLEVHVGEQTSLPRQLVIKRLLEGLGGFFSEHFKFFQNGFDSDLPSPILSEDDRFPRDFVMRYVIYRVAEDVNIIQQCVQDRRTDYLKETLRLADDLANIALRPAIQANLLPANTTALTYFQKRPTARTIPYATVALVGVPLTSFVNGTTDWRDLLATFHEVGHYVYWHGVVRNEDNTPKEPLRECVERIIEGLVKNFSPGVGEEYLWVRNWTEEVFADVYGALVGGAAIALNFQHLESQNSRDELLHDSDGDTAHPLPYVRPETYAKVVELADKPKLADTLRKAWSNNLSNRFTPPEATLDLPVNTPRGTRISAIPVSTINEILGKAAADILRLCLRLEPSKLEPIVSALNDVPENTPIGRIYSVFGANLQAVRKDDSEAVGSQGATQTAVSRSSQLYFEPTTHDWKSWAEKKGYKADPKSNNPIPPEIWLKILQADGWNTDGPSGSRLP